MIQIEIDQVQLTRALRKLKTLERLNHALKPAMEESLLYLENRLKREPKKAKGAFSAMATPAQRREYWARVRSGQIRHSDKTGYIRDHTTARSWTQRVNVSATGLEGTIGNNVAWARYVYSRKYQLPFHAASKWPVVEDVAEKAGPKVNRIFSNHLRRIIES